MRKKPEKLLIENRIFLKGTSLGKLITTAS